MEKQALRRGSPAAQQGPGRPRPPLQHRASLIDQPRGGTAARFPGRPKGLLWGRGAGSLPHTCEGHRCGAPRFADQRGARAAFTLSFLASSALYLLLAVACSPALPGVPLLFASRLPGALMHTLPGRAR